MKQRGTFLCKSKGSRLSIDLGRSTVNITSVHQEATVESSEENLSLESKTRRGHWPVWFLRTNLHNEQSLAEKVVSQSNVRTE